MYKLGIDVGGTNTDAALIRGNRIVATAKTFDSISNWRPENLS